MIRRLLPKFQRSLPAITRGLLLWGQASTCYKSKRDESSMIILAHRADPPLPFFLTLRQKKVKIIWTSKLHPLRSSPRDRRAIYPNHIKFMSSSDLAPMWTSPISESAELTQWAVRYHLLLWVLAVLADGERGRNIANFDERAMSVAFCQSPTKRYSKRCFNLFFSQVKCIL